MPSHLLVATSEEKEKKTTNHKFVQKLEKNLQTANQWGREHLHRGQRHQERQYGKKAHAVC